MYGTFYVRFFEFSGSHLVHFAKFAMLRFSKGYCSPSFHPVSTKLYEGMVIRGKYLFCQSAVLKTFYITLGIFVSTGPCVSGWKFQNATLQFPSDLSQSL